MGYTIDDPRFLPGGISGAGMEHTPEGRVVDTRLAVTLDGIDGCLIGHPTPDQPMYALSLTGTVGGGKDRARVLLLFPPEGAGALIDRLVGLAGMIGPDFATRLVSKVQRLQPAPPPAPPVASTAPIANAPEIQPDGDAPTAPNRQVA